MIKIDLPLSKSIANRLLVKYFVQNQKLPIFDENWSDDIKAMYHILHSKENQINAGDAGTAFRFGMACWAATPGIKKIITGSPRLLQRPIMPLVNALIEMGADLTQLRDGSWIIIGKKLSGGNIQLDASFSSQFESALLLIEPLMSSILNITKTGQSVSVPYVDLTKSIIENSENFLPEPDWSNAWVWIARSIIKKEEILLNKLDLVSIQGDSICATWGDIFGFPLMNDSVGTSVKVCGHNSKRIAINFIVCPDLAQVTIALAVLIGVEFTCNGLQTLPHKETNRYEALLEALNILNVNIDKNSDNHSISFNSVHWKPSFKTLNVSSLGDHRMSFFWAIIGLRQPLILRGKEAVSKSYPEFWEHWLKEFPAKENRIRLTIN